MILAGDEFCTTQQGTQRLLPDNESVGRLDAQRNAELQRSFVIVRAAQNITILRRNLFLTAEYSRLNPARNVESCRAGSQIDPSRLE